MKPQSKEPNQNMLHLPSQSRFASLSVPELQTVACAQDAMDHDAFSRSGSANSAKSALQDRDAYVPVNYISPEACALLTAAEISAARKADELDAGFQKDAMDESSSSSVQSALFGLYDPERYLLSMAPPKKFYRIFWQTISWRLLDQWAQAAYQSSVSKRGNIDSKSLLGHRIP